MSLFLNMQYIGFLVMQPICYMMLIASEERKDEMSHDVRK